ncbi:MAG: hypothetical protein AB7I27_15685 [Bacteriovoracaceae bacterium]
MKPIVIFLIFFLCHGIYQFYNMFLAKAGSSLTLLGVRFTSDFKFSLFALLVFTPFLTLANWGFGYGFQAGFKTIGNNIFLITTYFIGAQVLSIFVNAYFLFGLNLSKGTVVGFTLAMLGLTVAQLWK